MKVRTISSAILVALIAAAGCFAQPNVVVFWNPANRADTVMDFGVTVEGVPTFRNFTVENRSSETVAIYETRPDADPFYLIVNVPGVPPEDPRKEEFERVDRLPYFIPAGASRSFAVTFRALANNPLFPPDRVAEALLNLRVVDSAVPLSTSFNITFRLRALKTTKILGSTTPWIAFDSVYVNPAPMEPRQQYVVDNAINRRVPVEAQLFEMKTAVVGPSEIVVDTFPVVSFAPLDSVEWPISYRPYNRGLDSAHFFIVYRPDPTSRTDSVIATISGVGVEQRLTAISASGAPLPVVLRGDTVDFGAVPADGVGVLARITVRNDGNVNIGLEAEAKLGTLRDTSAFIVERPLAQGGVNITTNAFDTLDIRFAPTTGGDHRIVYRVDTDLQKRAITGVPDGAQTHQWVFVGFGQRPQIQVTPSEVDFGTVVLLQQCRSTSERTITVRNLGNAELRVDSIRVEPFGAPIVVVPEQFRLAPAESRTVQCTFEATTLGDVQAQIVFYTNSLVQSYAVSCSATVVSPDTTVVVVPTEISARPGSIVSVPIVVTPVAVSSTSRAEIGMLYNASLLRYRGLAQAGSASDGAQIVSAGELSPGSLRIHLQAPGNFASLDTFVTVLFDSYLGDQASAEISILPQETRFGNSGCGSVLTVVPSVGTYRIDSLCGIDHKTVVTTGRVRVGVLPNPVQGDFSVVVALAEDSDVAIRLVDQRGVVQHVIPIAHCKSGMSVVPIASSDTLADGMYTVVVGVGRRFYTVPIVVQK